MGLKKITINDFLFLFYWVSKRFLARPKLTWLITQISGPVRHLIFWTALTLKPARAYPSTENDMNSKWFLLTILETDIKWNNDFKKKLHASVVSIVRLLDACSLLKSAKMKSVQRKRCEIIYGSDKFQFMNSFNFASDIYIFVSKLIIFHNSKFKRNNKHTHRYSIILFTSIIRTPKFQFPQKCSDNPKLQT